jgi:WD40 repeat protein
VQKPVCDALAQNLAEAHGDDSARLAWLALYLLAPNEWAITTLDISGLDLEGRSFAGLQLDLLRADHHAKLSRTKWRACRFQRSSWQHVDARRMRFESISGQQADFRHANLIGGRWRKVNFSAPVFDEASLDDLETASCSAALEAVLQTAEPQRGVLPSCLRFSDWRLQEDWYKSRVLACALGADGQTIVTGSEDKTAKVWNAQGDCLLSLKGHQGWVRACALSADGQTIVTGSDETAKVWNAQGDCLVTLEGHQGPVKACALSADGQTIVTGSVDETAKVWNAQGDCLVSLKGHWGSVVACALSADGQTIVTGSVDKTAKVWNAQGDCLVSLENHWGWVRACAISADGQTIVTGSEDEAAKVWNAQGDCLVSLKGHRGGVPACAISADGQTIVTGSYDSTVNMWNAQGDCLVTLEGQWGSVVACALSTDGQTLVTSDRCLTKIWHQRNGIWRCVLNLYPETQTRIWLDAKTRTLQIDGPDWPDWQLHHTDRRSGHHLPSRLGETIAEWGPMAHEKLANASEWQFWPRDDMAR